jgi:hypothetical protein
MEQKRFALFHVPLCAAFEQLAQPLLHYRFFRTLRSAVQPLVNPLRCDGVNYGAADFNLESAYRSWGTVVLSERPHRERRRFKQTLRFNFNCVPDSFGVDERDDA